MSNAPIPAQGELVPITFEPVEVIDVTELEALFDDISARRANYETPSYIAKIIRAGGEAAVEQCLEWISKGRKVRPQGEDHTKNSNIHSDGGIPNDATIHHTVKGRVDAVFLDGTAIFNTLIQTTSSPEKLDVVTNQLLDEGLLNTGRLSMPKKALKTVIEPDDVLIFDHYQPHAFKSRTDGRHSIAYYF